MKELVVKRFVRIITTILMICFFMPICVVSCSGQELEVSAPSAMLGYQTQYQQISEPKLILSVLFIIPLAVLIASFIKRIRKEGFGVIVTLAGIVVTVVWVKLKAGIEKVAMEYMCEVEVKDTYTLCIVASVVLMLTGILCIFARTESGENGRICASCNASISSKILYCPKCGAKAESKAIVVTEPQEGWKCPKCGKMLNNNAKFCQGCGTAKEE